MSLEIGLWRTPWVASCACSPCVSRPGRSRVASTGWRGLWGKKSNLPQQPRGELGGRTASPSQTFRTCGPCQRLGCHLTRPICSWTSDPHRLREFIGVSHTF